jgi:hypothetical protein
MIIKGGKKGGNENIKKGVNLLKVYLYLYELVTLQPPYIIDIW